MSTSGPVGRVDIFAWSIARTEVHCRDLDRRRVFGEMRKMIKKSTGSRIKGREHGDL